MPSIDHGIALVVFGAGMLTLLFLAELIFAAAIDAAIRRMQELGLDAAVCRSFRLTAFVLVQIACIGILISAIRHLVASVLS